MEGKKKSLINLEGIRSCKQVESLEENTRLENVSREISSRWVSSQQEEMFICDHLILGGSWEGGGYCFSDFINFSGEEL